MPWQFRGDAPIYTQLITHIEGNLVSGAWSPGDRLPSVRELAAEAGVNPNTMQRALTELERRGLLYSQRTAGRFVTQEETMITELREELAQKQLRAFLTSMKKMGFTTDEIIAWIAKEGGAGA